MTGDNRLFMSKHETFSQILITNTFPVGRDDGTAERHDLRRGPDRGAAGVRLTQRRFGCGNQVMSRTFKSS